MKRWWKNELKVDRSIIIFVGFIIVVWSWIGYHVYRQYQESSSHDRIYIERLVRARLSYDRVIHYSEYEEKVFVTLEKGDCIFAYELLKDNYGNYDVNLLSSKCRDNEVEKMRIE